MMRLFILFCFLFTSCSRTHGFTLKKITSRTPTEKEIIGEELISIQTLFNAPLTYIGSGNHTYAFACADNKHVVKFFKQNHFGPYTWLDYLPLPVKLNPWRLKRKKTFRRNRQEAFESLELAKKYLKEQTGLIHLHLNRTANINRKAKLIYSETRQPLCDVDKMEFIVQKYAQIGFEYIRDLLKSNQQDQALQSLIAYLELIRIRCQKGLADRDLQFYKNFGFSQGKPVEIDITDFCIKPAMKEPEHWTVEVKNASFELMEFVRKECPDLLDQFNLKVESLLQ